VRDIPAAATRGTTYRSSVTDCDPDDTRASYDRIADEYVSHVYDELRHKPFDRALLDRFAESVVGPILDLGCGPGQIGRYLHDRGLVVSGLDLSPGMIARARRLNPGMTFEVGDLRALPYADGTIGGLVAFYSIIHVPRAEVVGTLREWARVLRPDARLLLAFHVGDEVRRVEELWGQPTRLDFVFYDVAEMRAGLESAGLAVVEVAERDPYPDVEAQTRRAYVLASRLPR
jgi:SAM-dependent methyltransferase